MWGGMVVSLTRGDTLYAYNAGEPMLPASTMKLLTSALAFERFGPNYQFSTDALRDGAVGSDGTLTGNLYIRGDGGHGRLGLGWRVTTVCRIPRAHGHRPAAGDRWEGGRSLAASVRAGL